MPGMMKPPTRPTPPDEAAARMMTKKPTNKFTGLFSRKPTASAPGPVAPRNAATPPTRPTPPTPTPRPLPKEVAAKPGVIRRAKGGMVGKKKK
jgi:hypothetical protein